MKYPIGCSTIAFAKFDLDTALEAIAGLGFSFIDLACIKGSAEHFNPLNKSRGEYQALNKKVRSHGLRVSTLNVNAGSFNDSKSRDEHSATVRAALDCGNVLGCACVTTKIGDAAEERYWEESANRSIGRIRELADYAATLKLKLSLEMPHTGTLAETLEQSIAFFKQTNHMATDVTLDTSHIYTTGADIREVARHFVGKLGHIHLRDANEKETHLVPGDGKIDFPFVYNMMVLAGFHRDYVVEIKFDEDKSLDDIKSELGRGLDEILPALKMAKKKKPEKK